MFNIHIDLGSITDWIQILFGTITIFLGGIALRSWKVQKNYEIISEAKANIMRCFEIYKIFRDYKQIIFDQMAFDKNGMSPTLYYDRYFEKYNHGLMANILQAFNSHTEKYKNELLFINYEISKILSYEPDWISQIFSNDNEIFELKNFYGELLTELFKYESAIKIIEVQLMMIENNWDNENEYAEDCKKDIENQFSNYLTQKIKLQKFAYKIMTNT